jgi:hypothetical protein
MKINDIILESYYDFVKDDNVEDIIDHAKSDYRDPSNPIYIRYVVKNNSKYDRITLIIVAYKPENKYALQAKQIDQEGWLIELRAMFIKDSNTHHETYNVKQFQKLMDKLNDAGNVERIEEDLRAWFGKGKKGGAGGGGWDRYNTKGDRIGKCGDSKPGEGKPKCLSKSAAAKLRNSDNDKDGKKDGKKAIANAVKRKKANDPNRNRKGKATHVNNSPKK